jgi:hypothetical protein
MSRFRAAGRPSRDGTVTRHRHHPPIRREGDAAQRWRGPVSRFRRWMASSDLQEGGLWRIRERNADAVSVAVEGTIAAGGVDRTSAASTTCRRHHAGCQTQDGFSRPSLRRMTKTKCCAMLGAVPRLKEAAPCRPFSLSQPVDTALSPTSSNILAVLPPSLVTEAYLARNREFESSSLHRRVRKLSIPLVIIAARNRCGASARRLVPPGRSAV